MRKWQIRPLHVGTLHRKRSNFLYEVGGLEPIDVPVTVFILESGDRRILVDTGVDDPATSDPKHHPFDRAPEQETAAAVSAAGTDPESIRVVINSHLHWDHCYGNHLFPNARFFVQAVEYRRVVVPYQARNDLSPAEKQNPPWGQGPFEIVDGDSPLVEGVSLLLTPGHTTGLQSVLVEAESGQYLLPSDNVPLYENWEGSPPDWPHIPSGGLADLDACMNTFSRMEKLGATVIPSHDFRILDTPVYR